VHGSALQQDNPDVPSCVDCHGVHNVPDPMTQAFRLKSPTEMCGKCHTDAKRMSKYDISTAVLNTYVADFHGTTTTLFKKQSPDQVTNKPVCFDCHGVHEIANTKDPKGGLAIKTNMLKACQKCHPDATTETFAASWTSHYEPSPTKYPIVYYINLFYQVLIPAVLGFMVLMVLLDAIWRIRNRFAGKEV
jgi:cytochrome c553